MEDHCAQSAIAAFSFFRLRRITPSSPHDLNRVVAGTRRTPRTVWVKQQIGLKSWRSESQGIETFQLADGREG
jgi:hypothetical protein